MLLRGKPPGNTGCCFFAFSGENGIYGFNIKQVGLAAGEDERAATFYKTGRFPVWPQRHFVPMNGDFQQIPGINSEFFPNIFREHHALVHPSFYEGLPNAVCEALAAGMPVVVSDVCDHSLLVAEGKRGFLFDPANPESIAAALHKLLELSPGAWTDLSADARKFAADHLGLDRMVRAYETLFLGLVDR